MLSDVPDKWRQFWRASEPVSAEMRHALDQRWAELPAHVRTPSQVLGRFAMGCEGTHGVFPRCNFTCTPCYHSADANRVRVDGAHSLEQVSEQMRHLRQRSPYAHAQLIGGEVSLLPAKEHGDLIETMRELGREPMSFSHGDFDYDYLRDVALDEQGRRRFPRLSFALHIDTTMRGRRGLRRTDQERELHVYRQRAAEMFTRLRHEHGVRSFLAHNMTITPENIDQIPEVVHASKNLGFGMFSFQPAAHVGDERRWKSDYHHLDADEVWRRIEEGAGSTLPYRALQVGDTRCNRTAWGFYTGDTWVSFFNEDDPRDMKARDALLAHFGGVHFKAPVPILAMRLTRLLVRHPGLVALALAWASRTISRAGGLTSLIRHRPRITTFVMHRFMHADDVKPAWALLNEGVMSDDPSVRETQERLLACSYVMSHPESNTYVPACVQHGVLDPDENAQLAQLLPLPRRRLSEVEG